MKTRPVCNMNIEEMAEALQALIVDAAALTMSLLVYFRASNAAALNR